jgi:antitoxin component YwqK of YwqJK toxin-antitoxin module
MVVKNCETMKKVKAIYLLILIALIPVPAICQKTNEKVKSIVVTEEKYDMLIKKQYKESESYYDTKGNLIESITYKLGKVDKHFKYQYDADNNKIKEEEFDPSGRIKESSEYKYADGLRTEKTVYDPNRKMKSRKTYVYTKF